MGKATTKKGLQKPDMKEAAERRAYIIEVIEKFGYYNISKKGLAERFGVSRQQIYDDIEVIKESRPDVVDKQEIKIEMDRLLKAAHAKVMRKLAVENNKPALDKEGNPVPFMSEHEQAQWVRAGMAVVSQEHAFITEFSLPEAQDQSQKHVSILEFSKLLKEVEGANERNKQETVKKDV